MEPLAPAPPGETMLSVVKSSAQFAARAHNGGGGGGGDGGAGRSGSGGDGDGSRYNYVHAKNTTRNVNDN